MSKVICFVVFVSAAVFAQSLITGRIIDQDGGPIPGVSVRLSTPGTALAVTPTRADGSFRFNANPGAHDLQATLSGFRPRTLVQVRSGDLGAISLQPLDVCPDVSGDERRVRVIDTDNRPVYSALVASACGTCWTGADGSCGVIVKDLESRVWAAHRDFEPALNSGPTVRLGHRSGGGRSSSKITVRVTTEWPSWSMELGGDAALLKKFTDDVDARRFDDWVAYLDGTQTSITFRIYGHTWTIARTQGPRVRLSLASEPGVIDGQILEGAPGLRFEVPPNPETRRLTVLEISR